MYESIIEAILITSLLHLVVGVIQDLLKCLVSWIDTTSLHRLARMVGRVIGQKTR